MQTPLICAFDNLTEGGRGAGSVGLATGSVKIIRQAISDMLLRSSPATENEMDIEKA